MAVAMKMETRVICWFLVQKKKQRSDLRRAERRQRAVRQIHFNLNIFSTELSLRLFRFRPSELGRVSTIVSFSGVTKRRRYRCDPITATCIMLRRLAFPCRWIDLEYTFGMSVQMMSEVFLETLEAFSPNMNALLCSFRVDLLHCKAVHYAQCIAGQGAPLERCVGFLDCTKVFISRPGGPACNQKACYSGHKRAHCLVYLTITTPDGLILYMYGPEEGRRHDMTLYRKSNLDEVMQHSLMIEGEQFYVYGDNGFVMRPWMQIGFAPSLAGPYESMYNSAMSSAREAVEWSYKDLKQNFVSNDFRRQLKVRKAPIALMYRASAVLWNMKVCMNHGGEVSTYFQCTPPTLDQYLDPLNTHQ